MPDEIEEENLVEVKKTKKQNPYWTIAKSMPGIIFAWVDWGLSIQTFLTIFQSPCYEFYFTTKDFSYNLFRFYSLVLIAGSGLFEVFRLTMFVVIAFTFKTLRPSVILSTYDRRADAEQMVWTKELFMETFKAICIDMMSAYLTSYIVAYVLGVPSTLLSAKIIFSIISALYAVFSTIRYMLVMKVLSIGYFGKRIKPKSHRWLSIVLAMTLCVCLLIPVFWILFGGDLFQSSKGGRIARQEVGVSTIEYTIKSLQCNRTAAKPTKPYDYPNVLSVKQISLSPTKSDMIFSRITFNNVTDVCMINRGQPFTCTISNTSVSMSGKADDVNFGNGVSLGQTGPRFCVLVSNNATSVNATDSYQALYFETTLSTQCVISFD